MPSSISNTCALRSAGTQSKGAGCTSDGCAASGSGGISLGGTAGRNSHLSLRRARHRLLLQPHRHGVGTLHEG